MDWLARTLGVPMLVGTLVGSLFVFELVVSGRAHRRLRRDNDFLRSLVFDLKGVVRRVVDRRDDEGEDGGAA